MIESIALKELMKIPGVGKSIATAEEDRDPEKLKWWNWKDKGRNAT